MNKKQKQTILSRLIVPVGVLLLPDINLMSANNKLENTSIEQLKQIAEYYVKEKVMPTVHFTLERLSNQCDARYKDVS